MEPYIGEIRMGGIGYAPIGWLVCDGSILQISQYTTLYSVIGTTYGGDGNTTFALPNLQGRVPLRAGGSYTPGAAAGTENVALTTSTMPQHSHLAVIVDHPAGSSVPGPDTTLAQETLVSGGPPNVFTYAPTNAAQTALAGNTIMPAGNNDPHENRQPYLAINFIIATDGIYPGNG